MHSIYGRYSLFWYIFCSLGGLDWLGWLGGCRFVQEGLGWRDGAHVLHRAQLVQGQAPAQALTGLVVAAVAQGAAEVTQHGLPAQHDGVDGDVANGHGRVSCQREKKRCAWLNSVKAALR